MKNPARYRGTSAYPVTVEELGEYGSVYLNITLVVLFILSVYCLYRLWGQHIEIRTKYFWSIVVVVPLLGPLLYGYCFSDFGTKNTK